MFRYLSRYTNTETGLTAFKRLTVKEVDGLFCVYFQGDYGNGAGLYESKLTDIKPYKTQKGAENAMNRWELKKYPLSLHDGLVLEGKI